MQTSGAYGVFCSVSTINLISYLHLYSCMQPKPGELKRFSAPDLHFSLPWAWDVLALLYLLSEQMVRTGVEKWAGVPVYTMQCLL